MLLGSAEREHPVKLFVKISNLVITIPQRHGRTGGGQLVLEYV